MYRLLDFSAARHRRRRPIVFIGADEQAFSALLFATWPEILFVPHNYVEARTLDPEVKDWSLQRGIPALARLDGLSYEVTGPLTAVRVWHPEPGWKPEWRKIVHSGLYGGETGWAIVNEPRRQFVYEGRRIERRLDNIQYGEVWSRFDPDDAEARSFVGKVWRMIARIATNVVDEVYDDTGGVRASAVKQPVYFGFHALDWARADPARRLAHDCRPVGSPGVAVPREYWMAQHCAQPELARNYASLMEAAPAGQQAGEKAECEAAIQGREADAVTGHGIQCFTAGKERRRAAKKPSS